MARTMDEGTAEHSAEELARLLERKGVSYGAAVGEAGLTLDLHDVPVPGSDGDAAGMG